MSSLEEEPKNGVSNKGYENHEHPDEPPLAMNGAKSSPGSGKAYVQFEVDGACAAKSSTPMEEVALHGPGTAASDEIRQLCPCEEDGRVCQCSGATGGQNEADPWNRCKMIALGIVTALVGVWLVVYITLSQKRVV